MDEASRKEEAWIEIHDAEVSSAELARLAATRAQQRRDEEGPAAIDFPPFGATGGDPEEGTAGDAVTRLHFFLRQLDQVPPPETQPTLAASPATRVPVLGRLWQLIRQQAHNLVLFYVNRSAARNAAVERHVGSALNELAALAQAQQAEIERLGEEVARLRDEGQESRQVGGQ